MVYSATLFNTDPYWDDFNEDKNFLRMLFRPGRSVQARELTQLQTIVQDQIKKFGDHIFKSGSRVLGGEIANQDVIFLRINPVDPTSSINEKVNIESLIGTDITSNAAVGDDTRRARVLYGITGGTSDNDNYYTLFVQYMDGGGQYGEQFGDGSIIKGTSGDNTYVAKVATISGMDSTDAVFVNGITGSAKLTTTKDGIFFVGGHFVKTDTQSISPYILTGDNSDIKNFGTPTSRIGFGIEKSIIEYTEDYTLRDPASGSFNYNAPGSDRYKISLKLDFKNFVNDASYGVSGFADANFIDLVRFVSGTLKSNKNYSEYSELEKTLARRTYDESGSYTTKPFEIDIRESLSTLGGPYSADQGGGETLAAIGLQPGKAYVFGYEFETQGIEYVLVDKARTTTTLTSQPVNDVNFGQYAVVTARSHRSLTGGVDISSTYPKVLLTGSGGATGTARIRQLIPNNDNFGGTGMTSAAQTYNMYLFDINLGSTSSGITAFENISYFGGTGSLGSNATTAGFCAAAGYTNENGWGPKLYQPMLNTSIFSLPVGNSVESVSDLTYRIYKGFTFAQTDATDIQTISSGSDAMSFVGTVDGSNMIYDEDLRDHYLLIGGPTGERINTNNVQFKKSTDEKSIGIGHATDALKQLPVSTLYTLYTTVDVSTPLVYRKKTRQTASTTNYVVDNAQQVSLSGVTGNYYLTLDHHDILDVTSVQDNNNIVSNATGLPAADVKDAFMLDNGQKDNYYDYGKLYLKPDIGVGGITGSIDLTITYDRFNHESGNGPFVVDSYTHSTSGFTFDNIPIYTSQKTGKSYSLRNCIDFRGTAQSDGTIIPDGLNPRSSSTFRATYDHHLSRIDKIILTKERKFDVIKGIPALNPQTPPDRVDAITLYVITVPAYTYNVDDITTKYIENKRYTMRDIGAIEKRVENLEYYTSLSLLEQQTEARSFVDSSGTDIFKNGIMVDAFRGHSVGDVLNGDYKCSIDYENGHLRPSFYSTGIKLEDVSNSGITITPDGIAMLDHTPYHQFVWQPFASSWIKANPFSVPTFMGHINFDDPFDNWYDQINQPTVKINSQGENDRWKVNNENESYGYGTQWNDWEVLWSGRNITESDLYNNRGRDFLSEFNTTSLSSNIEQRTAIANDARIRSTETLKNNEGRSGIRIRKLPERLEKLVNDRIVDVSVVPYMRAKTVNFDAYGLKPNTTVYPFFNGDNVSAYCGPNGGQSGGGLTTGSSGEIEGAFFSIPSATYKTGEKLFRITNSSSDTLASTTTAADGIYYAQGIVEQREGTLVSTRPIVSRRQVVNDNSLVRDAFDRDIYISTHENNLWLDPLAQTFTVSSNEYEDGVFLHSIDLFFQRRDENVPITLEIRPTINGYPHLSKVLPLSSVSLIPDASEIRENYPVDETYTNFKFTTPLYLTPGEYAMCLRTSSQSYNLYRATIGEGDLNSGGIISEQPYDGTLFVPQNTGISIPNPAESLKFKIKICSFDASGNVDLKIPSGEFTSEIGSSGTVVDTFKIASGEHAPRNTSFVHKVTVGSGVLNAEIISNENIYLETPQTLSTNADFNLNANLSTSNGWVSPVLDTKRIDLISVNNNINNSTDTSTNGELSANANSSDSSLYGSGTDNPTQTAGAAARYITRRVTLADGFESSNFKVLMSVNKPAEATIQVFIKALAEEDDTSFEEVEYTQMTADSTIPDSSNDYDFSESTFSLSSNFDKSIKTFAIKVCLYSSSSTKIPSVKDFRTIALNG
jgi:hypothetical protein